MPLTPPKLPFVTATPPRRHAATVLGLCRGLPHWLPHGLEAAVRAGAAWMGLALGS